MGGNVAVEASFLLSKALLLVSEAERLAGKIRHVYRRRDEGLKARSRHKEQEVSQGHGKTIKQDQYKILIVLVEDLKGMGGSEDNKGKRQPQPGKLPNRSHVQKITHITKKQ